MQREEFWALIRTAGCCLSSESCQFMSLWRGLGAKALGKKVCWGTVLRREKELHRERWEK